MGFIKDLLKKTFIYKLYDFCSNTYNYVKDKYYINETFHSREFIFVLNKYLKSNFKVDWLGRLYGIINPNINDKGEFDISSMIMEIDGENTNTNEYVKYWTYKQLQLIQDLFKLHKMYDYISIEFEHVGPTNMDNYLIIFDIASRQLFTSSLKKVLKHGLVIVGIIGVTLFTLIKTGVLPVG